MEIRPDPLYIPDIYGKNGDPEGEKRRLTLSSFLSILRQVTLILGLDLSQGLTPHPQRPAFAPQPRVGLEALNRTGFVANERPAFRLNPVGFESDRTLHRSRIHLTGRGNRACSGETTRFLKAAFLPVTAKIGERRVRVSVRSFAGCFSVLA